MNVKQTVVFGWIFLLMSGCLQKPSGSENHKGDDFAIRKAVKRIEAGWNKKSAALFSTPFAQKINYVTIAGLRVEGHRTIKKGHESLFRSRELKSSVKLTASKVRYLRPDVAIVCVDGIKTNGAEKPIRIALTLTMAKGERGWLIEAFQNTPVIFPTGGQRSRNKE